MAMASAAMSSNSQKRKKRPSPIDTGNDEDDGEFDNPLASSDEASSQKEFQAGGEQTIKFLTKAAAHHGVKLG